MTESQSSQSAQPTQPTQSIQCFPNHLDLKEINIKNVDLSHTKHSLTGGQKWVKSLTFKASTIEFSYQIQDNNRMLQKFEPEEFLTANFLDLRFDDKSSVSYIIKILTEGIVINDSRYHYLGQSNSQLKERKCFLINKEQKDIQKILDEFGDWRKFTNIAKLAKRIGLLFSSGENILELSSDKRIVIKDIEKNGHCFTDGCGFVSKYIIKEVQKKLSLEFRQKKNYPSVIQIRYQGFKGILLRGNHLRSLKDHLRDHLKDLENLKDLNGLKDLRYLKDLETLKNLKDLKDLKNLLKDKDSLKNLKDELSKKITVTTCEFRESMDKFKYKGPDNFFVVDYSKPYTFGRLNLQTVMLLSSLGIPDDIILKKQSQHFDRLELMFNELPVAFEYLLTNGQVDLAGDLFENGYTDKVIQYLNKSYKQELETSKKIKKSAEGIKESEKLRIIVEKSRVVFAAADPTRKLREDECFFRPTIQNEPTTITGYIFCVRNPCYHAGDIIALKAVHIPECENIVDVLLFSVNGDVPAAHRSAGGDLDGDKFFICWDEELMPKTIESYGYPGNKEPIHKNIQRADLIKNFAAHSNASVARCAALFTKWAEAKDPRCKECQEINKLFSHAVDGQSVKIPDHLTKAPEVNEQVRQSKVWNKLIANAEDKRLKSEKIKNDNLMKMDREEMLIFLKEEGYEATEYEMFNFLIRWCRANKEDIAEFLYHIDFSSFKSYEKLDSAVIENVPRHLLLNALNSSCILESKLIKTFNFGKSWKLFHRNDRGTKKFVTPAGFTYDFMNAVTNFRRVLVAIEFDHELAFCISLHGKFEPNIENDASGKIDVYGFNRGTMEKTYCISDYKLYYNEGHFQIYISNIRNTFIWIGVQKQLGTRVVSLNELDVKSQVSIAVEKLCQSTAEVTSKIRKKEITGSEIYVISDRDGLQTRYHPVNTDYQIEMEEVDIDADYHPLDPENPQNDTDKELLSLLFTNNLNELIKRMECWTKYGVYEKVITACKNFLVDKVPSTSDIDKLVDFTKRNPVFHSPLTDYIASNSLEIPSITFVNLIGTCFKASKCVKDVLVFENTIRLLLCCPVTLSNMQICRIIKYLINDFPHSETALEYMDSLFEILEKKHQSPGDDSTSDLVNPYFTRLIKMLCIQTLEEHPSNPIEFPPKKNSLNRYQLHATKTKKRYTLGQTGSIKVKVRPGDLVELKRLNLKSVESIPTIRAVVISTEPEASIDVSWTPRDITIATWEIKQVGNIIGFKHSMTAIQKLYPSEGISSLLKILLNPQDHEGSSTTSDNQNQQGSETSESPTITLSSQDNQPTAVTNEESQQTVEISEESRLQTEEISEEPLATSSSSSQQSAAITPNIQALNNSQQVAVNKAENGLLTLWQGPAGTGKTQSIFQLILQLLSRNNSGQPILVTAATNAAVDNVARKLVEHRNIRTIRIGDTGSIHPDLQSITLEAGLDGKIKRIHSKGGEKLLKQAQVICATCVGSGTSLLDKFEYNFIIIDEASQVAEPVVLIPLAKVSNRFVMVGDHKQLPPFCHPIAEKAGNKISLFERMYNSSYPVCLLDTQYRMHPGISKFPNDYFYEGKLFDGIGIVDRPLVNGFSWPNQNIPVAFVQVNGNESTFKGSKYNKEEVNKMIDVVKEIVGMKPQDIGIISLYNAQVEKIKEVLEKEDQSIRDIEVKTADGFQGREKELILITCVRCNENGKVGFLDDERRFNVMLTRAKRGLIIFGDRKTLCSNKMWKKWFDWLDHPEIPIKKE